jgi:hypothetical protein
VAVCWEGGFRASSGLRLHTEETPREALLPSRNPVRGVDLLTIILIRRHTDRRGVRQGPRPPTKGAGHQLIVYPIIIEIRLERWANWSPA